MVDWEEEDFEPAPPSLVNNKPKNQWDDEDADDENVKESWEDEEEPIQETKSQRVVETATKTGRKAVAKKEKQPEPNQER